MVTDSSTKVSSRATTRYIAQLGTFSWIKGASDGSGSEGGDSVIGNNSGDGSGGGSGGDESVVGSGCSDGSGAGVSGVGDGSGGDSVVKAPTALQVL